MDHGRRGNGLRAQGRGRDWCHCRYGLRRLHHCAPGGSQPSSVATMTVEAPEASTLGFSPELQDRLVDLRRAIHRHPELSFREHATADRLTVALRETGIVDVGRVPTTGVVARIPGRNRNAPGVAPRGRNGA